MEEEQDFVSDYDETMPAEESGEESPVPSDTLVVSVRCHDQEDPAVAGCSRNCASQVEDDPVLAGSNRKVVLAEGSSPAGFLGQQAGVFVRVDPGPSKGSECSECGIRTNHLKRHVVSNHIATRFWQIIPLMVWWVCRQAESQAVIRQHSGKFHIGRNIKELVAGVKSFFAFIYSELGLASEEELIRFVWTNGIIEPTSVFSSDELQLLDVLDQQNGTPYLPDRSAASPERLSSLLNWRTIHSLLLCCDLTRVPLNNMQVEIQNNNIPLVVAATSTEARTVEFSSPPNPPAPSCSVENHPPAVKTNKRKRRAKKIPEVKNGIRTISPRTISPGQYPPGQYPPGQYPPGQYPPG